MNQRKKAEVENMLRKRDLEGIVSWSRDTRGAYRFLNGFTFVEEDALLRWRAIEALGRVAGDKSRDDVEMARDMIRRQFWTMTEESGGTAWHAPEVIGEILFNVPALGREFTRLLAPFFKEEPFERGSYWGVARAALSNCEPVKEILEELAASLSDPDPAIRGFARVALARADGLDRADAKILEALRHDTAEIEFYDYDRGELVKTTVQEFIR